MNQLMMALTIAMSLTSIAEANLMKCTMKSNYNQNNPQITTGIIDTNDENSRIELNARNSQVQPFAMITAYNGQALVNLEMVEVISNTVDQKTIETETMKSLTGSNAGYMNSVAATDAMGFTHTVNCVNISK